MKKYFFLFLLLTALIPFFPHAANDQTFTGAQIAVSGYTIILDGSADSITVATSSFDMTISSSTTVTLTSNDRLNLDNTLGLTTNCGANSSVLTIARAAGVPQVTVTITPGSVCSSGGSGGGGSSAPAPAPAPTPPPPPPPPPPATTTAVVIIPPVISGKVSDINSIGIAGILVNATLSGGSGYVATTTSVGGLYALTLTEGTWDINTRPSSASGYYNPDAPKNISLKNGDTISLNFTLRVSGATVFGKLVDELGNAVSDASGFAILEQTNISANFGGQIANGLFSISAPAGTYLLTVYLPDDSSYTAGSPKTVTLTAGQTLSATMGVTRKNSFITGFLKDEFGAVLTGFPARVFAMTKEGSWQETTVDPLTGKYLLKVSSGSWYLGSSIDASSGYVVLASQELIVSVATGATAIQDLVVKKAGSIITGQVIDPLNNGVAGVLVTVNKISTTATNTQELKDVIAGSVETDAGGFYKIFVPAGVYYVRTFLKPGFLYANAEEKYILIDAGKTAALNFQLRTFQLKTKGQVSLSTTTINQAFVSAWSEKGGYQETQSSADGSYSLNVNAGDIWRISASKEISGVFYKSSESSVIIGTADATQNLALEKVQALPPPTISTIEAEKPAVVSIPEGPVVFAPAGAIAGGGSVSIIINPDARSPAQAGIKVVGLAYNFEARSATGSVIINFADKVTLSIPYNEIDVKNLGVFEDNMELAFWDEDVGAWRAVEDSLVNKTENIVIGVTNHFTRFAIVAPADTTPPLPPSEIKVSPVSGGRALITWKNPLRDFHHVKIYRSEAKNVFGQIVKNDISGTQVEDSGLAGGKTYYYLARSIDPAGNESKNTAQMSITTAAIEVVSESKQVPPGIAVKLKMLRSLTVGAKGDDVKVLQELLLKEGVYPKGLITGFFGNLTKQAVIRFQEKYADEILAPAGLKNGSGFVGPATLKKINALLSGAELSVTPAPSAKPQILKNLVLGDFSNEVKTLQGFLASAGVYPEGKITGFFGALTQKAVIRFQDKYADEILAPAGLKNGSGFVGALTRRKINELFK